MFSSNRTVPCKEIIVATSEILKFANYYDITYKNNTQHKVLMTPQHWDKLSISNRSFVRIRNQSQRSDARQSQIHYLQIITRLSAQEDSLVCS